MRPPSRSTRLLVVALLGALLLTACGGGGDDGPGEARLGVAPDQLLDFTAPTLGGPDLDASSLSGKPTVFWFWAPWCTICRGEAPDVESVAQQYGDSVQFVGVPGLGEVSAMKEFVQQTGTTSLTHAVDSDGSLWKRFGVTSQPAFVFVSGSGHVTGVSGRMKASALEKTVADLSTS